ncbi:MAG: LptF/LptG family permease [Bacteroidia bacterium]
MILKAFMGPWMMSLAIILFILVLQLLAAYLPEIAGKGLGLGLIGKMFFYASGRLMMQAMPVAILAGALMTFGGMGERNELASLKSSGVSLLRISKPMGILALIITAFMLWFTFELVPTSALKFYSLLYDVGRKKAALSLKPGHFYGGIDEYVIRIADRDEETSTLRDVLIYNHTRKHEGIDVIAADSARMIRGVQSELRMVLYAGVRHEEMASSGKNSGKKNHGRTYFDSLYYKFNLKGFDLKRTDEKLFSRHYMTLKQTDLSHALDSLKKGPRKSVNTFRDYIAPYTKIDSSYGLEINLPDSVIASKVHDVDTANVDTAGNPVKPKAPPLRKPIYFPPEKIDTAADIQLKPALPDTINVPLKGTLVDRFPQVSRTEVISKALGSARSVKNYAEFMIGKRNDQAKRMRRYIYEYQLRWATPFQCLVFMIIGISLGAIIRKGGMGLPGIISVAVLIFAYVVQNQGKDLSRDGRIDPVIGAWLPIIIFGPIGLWLLYLAAMEARFLSEESRGKWIGKVWGKISGLFSKET